MKKLWHFKKCLFCMTFVSILIRAVLLAQESESPQFNFDLGNIKNIELSSSNQKALTAEKSNFVIIYNEDDLFTSAFAFKVLQYAEDAYRKYTNDWGLQKPNFMDSNLFQIYL